MNQMSMDLMGINWATKMSAPKKADVSLSISKTKKGGINFTFRGDVIDKLSDCMRIGVKGDLLFFTAGTMQNGYSVGRQKKTRNAYMSIIARVLPELDAFCGDYKDVNWNEDLGLLYVKKAAADGCSD